LAPVESGVSISLAYGSAHVSSTPIQPGEQIRPYEGSKQAKLNHRAPKVMEQTAAADVCSKAKS
jgi:hypothetical protein